MRKLKNNPPINFVTYTNNSGNKKLKKWLDFYTENKSKYAAYTHNDPGFEHTIKNLKYTWDNDGQREPTILANYQDLSSRYHFEEHPQFLRFGFFHLEKSREGNEAYPSFFTRLIEEKVYDKNEIISVIGFLTKSEVLWDQQYNDQGDYTGYTTEAGYGIGDYWKEYFRGIKNLKKAKTSDLTLFRLNNANSPYNEPHPDLIEVKLFLKKSNGKQLQGMSTLDFLDYAVLISDSKASTPIEELELISK